MTNTLWQICSEKEQIRLFHLHTCTGCLKPYLWSKAGYVKEVHVAQVGQTHQCVFAVVFLSRGAEDHQGDLPHPTAFVRRQLKLGLSADFREGEHLETEQSEQLDLVQHQSVMVSTLYGDF